MLVTKEFTFDSAHNLPNYHGKCGRLHGPTYRLPVTIAATTEPESGMALDFAILGEIVEREVVAVLDHQYLNEIIPISSAENVTLWIWRKLTGKLPRAKLFEIRLHETPTSSVTYRGE